jgi:hypothetical protein
MSGAVDDEGLPRFLLKNMVIGKCFFLSFKSLTFLQIDANPLRVPD